MEYPSQPRQNEAVIERGVTDIRENESERRVRLEAEADIAELIESEKSNFTNRVLCTIYTLHGQFYKTTTTAGRLFPRT
jgi:hypothetical protein